MAREYASVEYRFNDQELLELGQQLAQSNQQIYDLRAAKMTTVATLGASIKEAEKTSAELTSKIARKAEMRDVEVISAMNRPRPGLKTIARTDNGEEVRIEAMTVQEQEQSVLDFTAEGQPS